MKIVLNLYIEEVNMLLIALGKLPLETSLGLWSKVQEQVKEQSEEQSKPSAREA